LAPPPASRRSSKSETRNPKQIQTPKNVKCSKRGNGRRFGPVRFLFPELNAKWIQFSCFAVQYLEIDQFCEHF
jgi:hypothetical protein